MVIKFKRKSQESIKDVGNSDMNGLTTCLTLKMRGTRVVGGGGAVYAPGIIPFHDDYDDSEQDEDFSKRSVSNEDLDEDLDLKQARHRSRRQL